MERSGLDTGWPSQQPSSSDISGHIILRYKKVPGEALTSADRRAMFRSLVFAEKYSDTNNQAQEALGINLSCQQPHEPLQDDLPRK